MENKCQGRLEGPPERQRATEHDDAPRLRARGAVVLVHVLTPRKQQEEAKELRLDDQGYVQVPHDHVDAERERDDAPEETVQGVFFVNSHRVTAVTAARLQTNIAVGNSKREEGWESGLQEPG